MLVRHEPNATLAEVRNALAADAQGDWLCHIDADDELEPGYLDAMAAAVAGTHPEWSPLLVPSVRYVRPRGQRGAVAAGRAAIPNRGGWPSVNECVIGTLVRRDCFDEVGGFREWPSIEDYDLWLRCFDAGACLVYVEDAVYRAHVSAVGRNRDQSCYATIWAEHEARTA